MRKILVMEDEDNIRAFVVLNLKRVGYDVVDVASGEAALEAFAQAGPQTVDIPRNQFHFIYPFLTNAVTE